MSDTDIARQSNDAEGYLIIDGQGDVDLGDEDQVQEDFSVQKVGDDDGSPKRQAVDMDEFADILNEGVEDPELEQPESNGIDHEGDIIAEDEIAEVKVEGVEAGVSIQWPGSDDEGENGDVETDYTPDTNTEDHQQREEEPQQEESVLIEVNGTEEIPENGNENSLIDVEPVAEDEPVVGDEPVPEGKPFIEDQPEIDDTPVIIDEPEIDDTPVVIDEPEIEDRDSPVIIDGPEPVIDEPEIEDRDSPVIIDEPEPVTIQVNGNEVNGDEVNGEAVEEVMDDLPAAGNVAIDVTLGDKQKGEEEERREEPKEDTTENEPISRDRGKSHRSDEPLKTKTSTAGSKRLDMSKFALFQKQSEDGADGPPKKNFTIKPVNKSPRFGNQGLSSTDQSNKCLTCDKRVYPMDKISADGKSFHKMCFRCTECRKVLNLGNYAALNSVIYCKPHFKQLFKLHGNYNTGFNQGVRSPQSSSAVGQQ